MKRHRQLRQRLRERSLLAGIFYKSAGYHAIEALGSSGLDYLVLDAEHAPFSPDQLDACLLAARAVDLPALVRVPDARTITLQSTLDMGAAGVLVPHVSSAAMAREVVAATRYAGGRRGFSNSTRAGGYGQVSMPNHIADSDRQLAVLCQIEDRSGRRNCHGRRRRLPVHRPRRPGSVLRPRRHRSRRRTGRSTTHRGGGPPGRGAGRHLRR